MGDDGKILQDSEVVRGYKICMVAVEGRLEGEQVADTRLLLVSSEEKEKERKKIRKAKFLESMSKNYNGYACVCNCVRS